MTSAPGGPRSGRSRGRTPGRGLELIVGGTIPSRSASTVKTASIAPAAPKQCPVAPFVDEIGVLRAFSSPSAILITLRLGRVAERGRGGVRVDVADLGRVDAGVGERHLHRPGRARAGRVGLGDVRRVGRDAVARPARRRSSRRAPSRARAPRARARRPPRPSRARRGPVSNGRDARCGSSLRRESARIASKPAMPTSVTGASRAAREHRRRRGRAGSRRAPRRSPCSRRRRRCTGSSAAPCVPSSIETQPAPMFGMIAGIENGLTRSGPRSRSAS